MVRLIVNGREHTIDSPAGPTLLDVLREDLGLTGAKYGCGEGECGACTVLVGDSPIRACQQDAASVTGPVTTVEALAAGGSLHPVQSAFVRARALQCGYCTPGLVMAAVALLARDAAPDDATVREALAGNICRCGGYPRIVEAIQLAATGDAGGEAVTAEPAGAEDRRPADAMWTALLSIPDDGAERGWGWSTPGGARLTIDTGGRVTAYTGKVEAGQGNRAALIRLVAAELGVPTTSVVLDMGDTACAPLDLGTVGSRSMPDAGRALRLVAATARRELVRTAAERWQVDPAQLVAADQSIHDPAGDRRASYGELIASGSRTIHADPDEPLPAAPAGLASLDDTMLHRYLVDAVTGAKRFPSDLTLPGLQHARLLRPPAHGAHRTALDTSAAGARAGVTVVEDGDLVAVVAPTRAAAEAALPSIQAQWTVGDQPADVDLEKYLRDHPREGQGWGGAVLREAGDVDAAFKRAEVVLSATYHTAYLAHAPLEPRVALATVDAQSATVWVGTQRPFAVQADVAAALGLVPEHVRIVVPDFGGGFGGKHSADVAVQAARLARATGRPVKVAWTRAEEFQWAYFRPA
ncbi:MAG: molybdopterin cofactor-binding domain-containing protein, partial [Micromonosporaceae bacterium]